MSRCKSLLQHHLANHCTICWRTPPYLVAGRPPDILALLVPPRGRPIPEALTTSYDMSTLSVNAELTHWRNATAKGFSQLQFAGAVAKCIQEATGNVLYVFACGESKHNSDR